MKKSLLIFLFPLVLSSCSVILSIPEAKRQNNISIGIEWTYDSANVNSAFHNAIDSVMSLAISEFNKEEDHTYKLHIKNMEDSAIIKLVFDKSRMAKNGEVAMGYIVSSIGLIGTPIYLLSASSGQAFLAFWYFPRDYIDYRASLSPYLVPIDNQDNTSYIKSRFDRPVHTLQSLTPEVQTILVTTNACFTIKSNRMPHIATKFKESIMRLFYQLENQRYNP